MTGNMETKMEEALAPSQKQMVHQVSSTSSNVGYFSTVYFTVPNQLQYESVIIFYLMLISLVSFVVFNVSVFT